MFRVVAGMVRLSVLRDDGREMVYCLLQAGDCFGEQDLVSGKRRTHMAEAENEVEVQVLSLRAFNALRLAHHAFDDALLRLLADSMEILADYLAGATFDELPSRLAQRLLDTARPDAAGRLAVRVPQTELALMVGASRQTVNKILRHFEAEGLVSLGYGSIIILDPGALADRPGMVREPDSSPGSAAEDPVHGARNSGLSSAIHAGASAGRSVARDHNDHGCLQAKGSLVGRQSDSRSGW